MHLIQRHTLKNLNKSTLEHHKVELYLQHYTSDIPLPPKDIQTTTYVDDITITVSHTKHCKAQQLIQPYLHKIYEWVTNNNLHINTHKTTTTIFTPDPAEYSTTLSLELNNQT